MVIPLDYLLGILVFGHECLFSVYVLFCYKASLAVILYIFTVSFCVPWVLYESFECFILF